MFNDTPARNTDRLLGVRTRQMHEMVMMDNVGLNTKYIPNTNTQCIRNTYAKLMNNEGLYTKYRLNKNTHTADTTHIQYGIYT